VLLTSFMHMQLSVIVEFAVGVAGVRCALQQNQEVRLCLLMAGLPLSGAACAHATHGSTHSSLKRSL